MNKLGEMATAVADVIREKVQANSMLANGVNVTVLVEDKLNTSFTIDDNLGRNRLCVIVGVTSFNRKQNTGALVYGTIGFDVSVFENPMMNRETELTPTAQMVAEFLIKRLHWAKPSGFETPLIFESMTRADEVQMIVERMRFVAEAAICNAGDAE